MTTQHDAPPPDDSSAAQTNPQKSDTHRLLQELRDLDAQLFSSLMVKFRADDVFQIVVGAAVLAIPIACTEEVWNLSKELPRANIAAIFGSSVVFMALFVYHVFYRGNVRENAGQFAARVGLGYLITLLTVVIILALFQRFPLVTEPEIALRRTILVGFPACFSATVVDSLK